MTSNAAEATMDEAAVPYRGEQPYGIIDDVIVPGALDLDADERLSVSQSKDVSFRPFILSASQGYFVNILRVRKSGILSRHRHAGPVHAITLKGRWHYLEHEWWGRRRHLRLETPGDIHTLVVPDGVEEMATLFHVTGTYIYVDPDGNPTGIEDVFTKIALARAHYEAVGFGADYVDQFIR